MTECPSDRADVKHLIQSANEVVFPHDIAGDFLQHLRRLTGARQCLLYCFDERHHRFPQPLGHESLALFKSYVETGAMAADPIQAAVRAVGERMLVRLEDMPLRLGDFYASSAYQDFYEPLDLHHHLNLQFGRTFGGSGMIGVTMWRGRHDTDFEPEVRQRLEESADALVAMTHRCRRLWPILKPHELFESRLEGAELPAKTRGSESLQRVDSLSPRERQVARLVATGLSDLNTAARLGISESTVGTHLRRIYRKLRVHSRLELAHALSLVGKNPIDDGRPR